MSLIKNNLHLQKYLIMTNRSSFPNHVIATWKTMSIRANDDDDDNLADDDNNTDNNNWEETPKTEGWREK